MIDKQIHNKILQAREKRALLRSKLAKDNKISISLNLNIPGYPKSNDLFKAFFKKACTELVIFLEANRIFVNNENEIVDHSEAGDFYLITIKQKTNKTAKQIKQITEKFEHNFDLGRFIDVDVCNEKGEFLSSGKEKICFYCLEKPAIVCMREKAHDYSELQRFMLVSIKSYLNKNIFIDIENKLIEISLKSIFYEISLHPKPGLVTPLSNGSHNDMEYYDFLRSTAAITPYLRNFIELGFVYRRDLSGALVDIRKIGLQMEIAMNRATNKVNTQKGIIFIFGIALFTIAYNFKNKYSFSEANFRDLVAEITKNIVNNELIETDFTNTHGEKTYKKYGSIGAGVRLEAEKAFPMVFEHALPFLKSELSKNEFDQKQLLKLLLKIISVNNDSNVLYRSNLKVLQKLQHIAKLILKNEAQYNEIEQFCLKNNISPGGSADLLSLCLLIYETEKTFTDYEF